MTKALLEIKDLKARVRRHDDERAEPIAIIGMACRFPGGANNPALYWDLLREGVDAIGEVPLERWDIDRLHDPDRAAAGKMSSRFGGFIDDIGGFDAAFFGISPREAESLDPHQRILLEVCWEALEHANVVPEELFDSNSGVFIGVSSMDQVINRMGREALAAIGPYHGTGCAMAPIAGRVSYTFGFSGPSFVVDTACSSSLLSLHLAAESLRRRECNLALGGGVHLLFHPGYSIAFSKAGMLAADGRCKTFDAAADGYVRGEGCGVVVLKRLSDALRDGDAILALLRGSAVNQDGASGGLTVPSGPSQEQVVRQALARAGIDSASVGYVEAHGTGTPLGDPIELGALGNVFKQPLLVGSVKSNIGHLEASAGIASAIKVILSLQHKSIPPHLHLRAPNPLIPWQDLSISVPTRLTPWRENSQQERIAGVSAFGFSGTNVHVLLSGPPAAAVSVAAPVSPVTIATPTPTPALLVLSARSQEALRALAQRWVSGPLAALQADPQADLQADLQTDFVTLCATAATCRTHFSHRLSLVADNAALAAATLAEFALRGHARGAVSGSTERTQPSVAFLFTGQGAQYVGMGRALYLNAPVFRAAVDACDVLLQPQLGCSLVGMLYPDDAADHARCSTLLDATAHTQPALFVIGYALSLLWQSWGVKPAAVLGHSVGEYVAAHLAGVFSLEDALRLVAARARLMQALPAGGAMAAVLADPHQVEAALASVGSAACIAAYNGPRNTVLSGALADVEHMLAHFRARDVECRPLAVSHAFHSALMAPMLEAFRDVAASVSYHSPRLPVISNITGLIAGAELASADYWVRHVRAPVRFSASVAELVRNGQSLMIEMGPSATLVAMARHAVDDPSLLFLPSMRKHQPQLATMLDSLGQYWNNGGAVNWSAVGCAPRRDLRLPTYPFTHRHYAHSAAPDGAREGLHGACAIDHPLLARRFSSPLLDATLFESVFSKQAMPFLDEHRVFGQLVVAGASHLSLILSAAALVEPGGGACQLKDVMFPVALVVPEEGERIVQLAIGASDGAAARFRLMSLNEGSGDRAAALHAKGTLGPAGAIAPAPDLRAIWQRCSAEVALADVYDLQQRRHIVVGPGYQWLTALRRGDGETIATLCAPAALRATLQRYSLHPGLIDSCFGALVMAQSMDVEESFIPFSLASLQVHASGAQLAAMPSLVAHAVVREHDALRLVGDIWLYDEQGTPVATFIGLEGRRASRAALLAAAPVSAGAPAQYQVRWHAVAAPAPGPTPARWLILADAAGIGAQLAANLRRSGVAVTLATADPRAEGLERRAGDHYALAPASAGAFAQLTGAGFDAVVYLWGIAALEGPQADGEEAFSAYQQHACAAALHLLQALAGQPARLWLATRGSQAVRDGDAVPAPHQALLWGLGQVAAAEHMACVCVDLDPAADIERCAAELLAVCGQGAPDTPAAHAVQATRETRLAWRDGAAYTARLEPAGASKPAAKPAIDSAGTYLITGASGALGRELAAWLARRGARHLALLARSPADPMLLAELTRLGAQPLHYQCDVADRAALALALARIALQQAPLAGIFHLAGALDDGLIATQNWERWKGVLAAKASGAWHLHALTQSLPLSLFVGFSSAAALLGNPGQASYAAANGFVDALAHHRRARGLAALSVNWGPWAEGGMATRLDAGQRERLAALGVGSLEATGALDMLGTLIDAAPGAQVGVLAMAWPRYGQAFPSPFLAHLAGPGDPAPPAGEAGNSVRQQLQLAAPSARKALLVGILMRLVVDVLRLERNQVAPRERLFDLGIDSLLAVELKNRLQGALGVALGSTLLFDYPTIEALADHLLGVLAPAAPARARAVTGVTGAIDELSEAEAESMLLAQIEQLEGRLP